MLKLDNMTPTDLIDKGVAKRSDGAAAETFCGALRTAFAVFTHRLCTDWCKSLSQPLKCNSLTPHEAPELAKLQTESYVGVR